MKDKNMDRTNNRNALIVRSSIIGIIANVFLAAFKAVVGLASNSIAIVMDAGVSALNVTIMLPHVFI